MGFGADDQILLWRNNETNGSQGSDAFGAAGNRCGETRRPNAASHCKILVCAVFLQPSAILPVPGVKVRFRAANIIEKGKIMKKTSFVVITIILTVIALAAETAVRPDQLTPQRTETPVPPENLVIAVSGVVS